jgi:hypothetical protein
MRILDRFPVRTARPVTEKAIADARNASVWDLGNRTLYDLCQDYPRHKTPEEIIAKVWLIGRSYAASIERRRNSDQFSDGFYEATVAPTIMNSGLDEWLASVSKEESDGTSNALVVHKRLMDLFASITKLEKRSLTSKYLHFHRPDAFFIYDSRARRAITKVVPRLNRLPDISAECYDQEYKDFVRRCAWLRTEIWSRYSVRLTPREIDKLLLAMTVRGSFTGVTMGSAAVPQ